MITFPRGMSQRARNGRPRPRGPQECGSVAQGSPWKRLVALLVATPQNGAGGPARAKINFVPLPGTLLRSEQCVRGGQGLLRAVWSRREASYFRGWLTEQDDDSAEALGPVSSCGFGLCSPADFAVTVRASSISQQLRTFPERNKRGR